MVTEVNLGPILVYAMTETTIHEYFAARQNPLRFAVGQDARNLRSGIEQFGLGPDTLHLLGVVVLVGLSLAGASHRTFRASEDRVR